MFYLNAKGTDYFFFKSEKYWHSVLPETNSFLKFRAPGVNEELIRSMPIVVVILLLEKDMTREPI